MKRHAWLPAGLTLFLTAAGTFLWWYAETSSVGEQARTSIESSLRTTLGRAVKVGAIDLVSDPERAVIIRDVKVAGYERGTTLATIDEIRISGGVDSLTERRIRLDTVIVRGMHITLDARGRSQLESTIAKWSESGGLPVDIAIHDLRVIDGSIAFRDREKKLEIRATNFEGHLDSDPDLRRHRLTIATHVAAHAGDGIPIEAAVRAILSAQRGITTIESLDVKGPAITARATGSMTMRGYKAEFETSANVAAMLKALGVDAPVAGNLDVRGRLHGHGGSYALEGEWSAPRLQARKVTVENARGIVSATERETRVEMTDASFAGGTARGEYRVAAGKSSAAAGLRGAPLPRILSQLEIGDAGFQSLVSADVEYRWAGSDVRMGSGNARVSLAGIALHGVAAVTMNRGGLRLSEMSLKTPLSQVQATGFATLKDATGSVFVVLRSEDFAEVETIAHNVARAFGHRYERAGIGGNGEIGLHISGPFSAPAIVADAHLPSVVFRGASLGKANVRAFYDAATKIVRLDRLRLEHRDGWADAAGTLRFTTAGGMPKFAIALEASRYPIGNFIALDGSVSGRASATSTGAAAAIAFDRFTLASDGGTFTVNGRAGWSDVLTLDVDVVADSFPVAELAKAAKLDTLPLRGGRLSGEGHVERAESDLSVDSAFTVTRTRIYGEPADIRAKLTLDGERLRIADLTVTAPAGTVRVEGSVNLHDRSFTYNIPETQLALDKLTALPVAIGGTLVFRSAGSGSVEQPAIKATAVARDLRIGDAELPAPVEMDVSTGNGRLTVNGSARDLFTIGGEFRLGPHLELDGRAELAIEDIGRLTALIPAMKSTRVAGKVDAALTVDGSSADILVPQLHLRVNERDVESSGPIRVAIRDDVLSVEPFTMTESKSSLRVGGRIELAGGKRVDVKADGTFDVASIEALFPALHATGTVAIAIAAGGTINDVSIDGSAELRDGGLRSATLPEPVEDASALVRFTTRGISLERLDASIGGGKVTGKGSVDLDGLTPSKFEADVQATNVALRDVAGASIAGDAKLRLRGTPERAIVGGDVRIRSAVYSRDINITQMVIDLLMKPPEAAAEETIASWKQRIALDVKVVAADTFGIRNNLAQLSGKADLNIVGTLARPSLTGEVTLDEGGRVRIQNNDYRTTRASVSFQNPQKIDPYFDISLEGRVTAGGLSRFDDSGQVDVTINITGNADRLTPTITTSPPSTDITLLSLLGFSGTESASASNESGSVSPGGVFASSVIAHSVLAGLPFASAFSYDPGVVDQTEDPGPKLRFRHQFPSDVGLVIIYNLDYSHSRSRVDWQARPELTLLLTRDELRQEYRAEARVRRRYLGHWTCCGAPDPIPRATAPPPPAQVSAASAGPERVAAIHYDVDGPFDVRDLSSYVRVKLGEPLSRVQVQESLKAIFATGQFLDAHVDTHRSDAGEVVTFNLKLKYRVGEVTIDGLSRAERRDTARIVNVRSDDLFSLDEADAVAGALRRHFEREGFLRAVVDVDVTFDADTHRASVAFTAERGAAATVAEITLSGDKGSFSDAELTGRMRNELGSSFRRGLLVEDANRMQQLMEKADHENAQVRFVDSRHDTASNTVALTFAVEAGPKMRIDVNGVSRRSVKSALRLLRNRPWTDANFEMVASRVKSRLQLRGYHNAIVTMRTEADSAGVLVTTLDVKQGEKVAIAPVVFDGNGQLSDKALLSVVSAKPKRGLARWVSAALGRSGTTTAAIEEDRLALEAHYRRLGFSEAAVRSVVAVTETKSPALSIRYEIAEGPQTRISSVAIAGNSTIKDSSLPRLRAAAGSPLDSEDVQRDVLAIENAYAGRGYTSARVDVRSEVAADKTSASVTYDVREGTPTTIGSVVVRGNTYTDSSVVAKQAGLREGEPFTLTSLLEAQRSLGRLGAFERADVVAGEMTPGSSRRNVVLDVEEGKVLNVSASIGFTAQSEQQTSLIGGVSIANSNLFGTGRSMSLNLVGSYPNVDRREAFLTYREPFVGRRDLPLTFNVFRSEEVRPGAHIAKNGASAEVSRGAGTRVNWVVRYEYLNSLCTSGDLCLAGDEALVPGYDEDFSDELTSSVTGTIYRERRDDPVDPHRGYFASVSLQYAFPLFAAHTQFLKESIRASWYKPLGPRSVFVASGRLGFIQGIGPTRTDTCSESESCVPLTQRFVSGGESTHRAFPLDLLGNLCEDPSNAACEPTLVDVDGTISPIGGLSQFVTNFEYRFPVVGKVSAAVFTDIGNVFANGIRLSDLRYGVGGGVRYLSPIGPLRFDIGYKLDRQPREDPLAYFLTFGYAF